MKRALGALAWVVVAACVPRVPTVPLPAEPKLEVTLEVPAQGPVKVHLHLDRAWLPEAPRQATFTFAHLDEATARAFVTPLPSPRAVSAAADLDVAYEVELVPQVWGATLVPLESPFDVRPGVRYLPLAALVPVLRLDGRALAFAPAVLRVRSPLPLTCSLPSAGEAFVAPDLHQLYAGLLLAGPVETVWTATGLRLVSPDFSRDVLERAAALEARASARLAAELGPRRPLDFALLLRHPGTPMPVEVLGFNAGPVVVVRWERPLDARATSLEANSLVHELVHSSLPPEDGLPAWMTEGFAEYFARRLTLDLDGFPPGALRETLVRTWSAFVQMSPGRTAKEGQLGSYYGGAVLAHCVDVRLRRDGASLGGVLQRARARAGGLVTSASWEQEIALASAPAGGLVLGARTDALDPPETCFAEEGFVPRGPVPAVSRATLGAWLGVVAVSESPRLIGVEVLEVSSASPLRATDVVVEARGVRVRSLAHLAELMVPAQGVTPLPLVVMRDGARLALTVPLPPDAARAVHPVPSADWVKQP